MEISIWGKNILDNKYPIRAFYFALEPPNWEDKLYLSYGEPINIGITFKYCKSTIEEELKGFVVKTLPVT